MTTPSTAPGSPSVKRARTVPPGINFRATFPQPQAFHTLLQQVNNVVSTLEARIVKNEEFEGLCVESIDANQACLVIAKLPCMVDTPEGVSHVSQRVCLSIECLTVTLPDTPFVLEQQAGMEESVSFRTANADEGNELHDCVMSGEFNCLVPGGGDQPMDMASFTIAFQIEIEVQLFRGFLKKCEKIGATDINISVTEKCRDGIHIRVLVMKVDSKAVMKFQHELEVPNPEGSGEGEYSNTVFDEDFSCKYLNNFVKSMEPRKNALLQMAPNNPLHIISDLGIRGGSVKFILAPKVREDD